MKSGEMYNLMLMEGCHVACHGTTASVHGMPPSTLVTIEGATLCFIIMILICVNPKC